MSEYSARISWERNGADFINSKYHRRHRWDFDGEVSIRASASPTIVPEPWSDPEAVDPEEAFIASLSSCHMLWFLALVSKEGYMLERYRDQATGVMERNEQGKQAIARVILKPRVFISGNRIPTEKQHKELHLKAHECCFIANSVKTVITINPSIITV